MRKNDSRETPEFQDEVRKLNPKEQKDYPTVLIVDNEPVITDTLALILTHYGYRCTKAYNSRAGLARAREVNPDMVISGVINGDGPNGIDMAIEILAEMPETKILLFSGQAATVDLLGAASAKGRDLDLVMKPVDPVALIHWCASAGVHDVRSCHWCRERWVSSGGAYPHGELRECACPWCRVLTDRDPPPNPHRSVPPEEDARLPILEAEIEREWRQWRPKYVRDLVKDGRLQSQIRETALWCIDTMNRGQERGMNPDQCREMIRPLIHPQFDNS